MINGEKIALRLVKEQDLEELYSKLSDLSHRGKYFPLTLSSHTQFKKHFFETGFWSEDFGRFLIFDKKERLVGSIYYFKTAIYSDSLELGYLIFDKMSNGKGYMTEALELMVDYLFSTKTMNRIQLRISPQNEPSIKLASKVGFQFDGTRKQIMFLHGKHIDLNDYVLLREMWKPQI